MPPQVISMRTIRRLYPSKENVDKILAANPGAHLGIITKIGAMAKTRTLTTIRPFVHKKTLRTFYHRKDTMIHDELEETVPTDVVLTRFIGLISTRKRHAFSSFVSRIETPEDPARRAQIQINEAARLKDLETNALERANLVASRADLARRAVAAGVLPEDLQRIEDEIVDRESEEEMEREREREKIRIERVDLVDRLRAEVVARLKDGFEGVEDGETSASGSAEASVFETLGEKKRAEIVERELRNEINRVGNEAAIELDYEETERELDNRVAARRARAVWLEMEERRQAAEQKKAALASQTASVADEMEKLRAKLRGWNIEPVAPRPRDGDETYA